MRRLLNRLVDDSRLRRRLYAAAAIVFIILCFVPRPYVARARIQPQDASSLGLGGLGSSTLSFAALLGDRNQIDVYLLIGRSDAVASSVIKRANIVGEGARFENDISAKRWLQSHVDVDSLTGGILEVSVQTHDQNLSLEIANAYVGAISDRIKSVARERTVRKQVVIRDRMDEASRRLSLAESAMIRFRRDNRLADPDVQLGSQLALRASLEAQLQAKRVELETRQRFAGPENQQVIALQQQIASLQAQISQSTRPQSGATGPNLSEFNEVQARYLNLFRDYRFAQTLYEAYTRYMEQVAVEEFITNDASDVVQLQPTYIDPAIQFNIPAAGALLLVLLAAIITELYGPATGLTWPWKTGRGENSKA